MLPILYEKKKKKHWMSKLLKAALALSLPFLAYQTVQKLAAKYDKTHGTPKKAPPSGSDTSPASDAPRRAPEERAAVDASSENETSSDCSHLAAVCYREDTAVDGENFTATASGENAILITDGANVTINHAAITVSGEEECDRKAARLYGVGAAVLAINSNAAIVNTQITSDRSGGTGIFAYQDGVVRVTDTAITTQGTRSDGLRAVKKGMISAKNLTVETSGAHSAALSSVGSGSILVSDGGSYKTHEAKSPAICCAAEIALHQAKLSAALSEAVQIKGCSALHLFDADLTSGMTQDDPKQCTYSIGICDNPDGQERALFHMTGGSITAKIGGIFYAKDTHAAIYLNHTAITHPSETDFLLTSCQSELTLTAEHQKLEGNLLLDHLSRLDLYLRNGTTLTGAALVKNRHDADDRCGTINVYLDSESEWIVTEDSIVTNLYSCGTIKDPDGRTVRILDQNGNTLVKGTSHYKITVSRYETTADFTGATDSASFEDFAI